MTASVLQGPRLCKPMLLGMSNLAGDGLHVPSLAGHERRCLQGGSAGCAGCMSMQMMALRRGCWDILP